GDDSLHSSVGGRELNGMQIATSTSNNNNNNDSMMVTEHQMAKLMEEDMGSAMNPMPSTLNHPFLASNGGVVAATTAEGVGDGPSSPSLSVLIVQSAMIGNGIGDASSVKDAASVSKP
ncbi:hypothetical protein U1Q18_028034, partial [Sarracenia purpurea var. burkii]